MPCLSSWPSACDIKSRYLSEDLGSYTVPSHGVAVLTMSKPWQLYLLPSEWSSVTERNETLKLLVPNDHHHQPPASACTNGPSAINAAALYLFFATLQVPQKTANQSAQRPSQIQSILHILPDGRRRGELAMVNEESHPSGRIPERALPP